jgi:hypothetical protein
MALIVGHDGPSKYSNTIANRTAQSGGSVGGNKKPGTWAGNTYMSVYNIGNAYTNRIAQREPTLKQLYLFTTRSPVQLRRGGYAVTHSGML